MRKTIHRFFWAWNFEKEEKWLNEMSAMGLQLVAVGPMRYDFEQGTPGEYRVRLQMLDHYPSHPESEQYIRFIEDTGAQYVGSVISWVYFRKKTDTGEFELFSDIDSRIGHFKRLLPLFGILSAFNLYNGFVNLFFYFDGGYAARLYMGVVCALFGILITWGFLRIFTRMRKLKRDRKLYE